MVKHKGQAGRSCLIFGLIQCGGEGSIYIECKRWGERRRVFCIERFFVYELVFDNEITVPARFQVRCDQSR